MFAESVRFSASFISMAMETAQCKSEAVDNGSKIKKKMTPSMKIFEVGNYLVLVDEIKFYFSFDSDSNTNVSHILSFPFFSVTGSFSIKQKDLVYI